MGRLFLPLLVESDMTAASCKGDLAEKTRFLVYKTSPWKINYFIGDRTYDNWQVWKLILSES
jgi:hypothetical protein